MSLELYSQRRAGGLHTVVGLASFQLAQCSKATVSSGQIVPLRASYCNLTKPAYPLS